MTKKSYKACVAFPNLRREHLAKDVFKFPTSIFGKNIIFFTRNSCIKKRNIFELGGNGITDKFTLHEAIRVSYQCSKFEYAILFHTTPISFLTAGLIKLFSFLRGKKTITILQSDYSPIYLKRYNEKGFTFKVAVKIFKFFYTPYIFNAISTSSDQGVFFMEKIIGLPSRIIFKIYNCPDFDTDFTKNPIDKSRLNKIIFSGRKDDPKKNIPNIIRAFESIAPYNKDWSLEIIGPGNTFKSKLNNNQLLQTPNISSRNEILYKYMESKIFLLASHEEGASLSFVESLRCGCYPVATDTGNFSELINSIGHGLIIGTSTTEIENGLLQAINTVNNSEHIHSVISENSKFINWKNQTSSLKEYLCIN